MTGTATFSSLLRTPNRVLQQLDDGDVLLTRRGSDPLVLSKARSSDQEKQTLKALAQLIAAAVCEEGMLPRLMRRLTRAFPWLEFLPENEREAFVDEFLRVALACADRNNFERLTVTLNAWTATADAYAAGLDPKGDDLDHFDNPPEVSDPAVGR